MSKISYCSIEEAWGTSFKEKDDKVDNKYEKMDNERIDVISNMNQVERNQTTENNSIVEYEKYRFNPENKVVKNNNEQTYTPFNESIEKKYLQDKLNYLENEFRRYKYLFDKSKENNSSTESIENFQNEGNTSSKSSNNGGNDIIDLILLIIIGLIVIFVMNSIFNIGKVIGSRNSIIKT